MPDYRSRKLATHKRSSVRHESHGRSPAGMHPNTAGLPLLTATAPACCYSLQALGDSLDERPTHAAVQEASRQAAEATQQQLAGLAAELDAVKARLRGAGQDLQQLKDWQVRCCCWCRCWCCARVHRESTCTDLCPGRQEAMKYLTALNMLQQQ